MGICSRWAEKGVVGKCDLDHVHVGNAIWKKLELFIHVRGLVAMDQASGTANGIVCNRSRPFLRDLR